MTNWPGLTEVTALPTSSTMPQYSCPIGVGSVIGLMPRYGAFDLTEIVGRKFDCSRSDVLLQAMQLRGARDRNDPRLLGQQPGERDLSRCRLLPFCDLAKQIDQGLIRFPSLRRKARDDVAEVGTVERRVFVDLSREEALAQRAEWNEADPEFLERRQHFLFRASPPQRVFALDAR